MRRGNYLSTIAFILVAIAARADEPAKPVTIHGFIDGYYAWNANDPASHENFVPGTGSTAKRADEFDLDGRQVEIEFVRALCRRISSLARGRQRQRRHSRRRAAR